MRTGLACLTLWLVATGIGASVKLKYGHMEGRGGVGVARVGLIWIGLVWYGWFGLVMTRFGLVWLGLIMLCLV